MYNVFQAHVRCKCLANTLLRYITQSVRKITVDGNSQIRAPPPPPPNNNCPRKYSNTVLYTSVFSRTTPVTTMQHLYWNTLSYAVKNSKRTWCLMSTETIRLIRDGETGGKGYGGGGRGRLYTYHYTVTTRMTLILLHAVTTNRGYYQCFIIVTDNVARQW